MKIILFVLSFFCFVFTAESQIITNIPPALPDLLGVCTKDSMLKEPFKQWFETEYSSYSPDLKSIDYLKKFDCKDISIKVFFGTWCGDSRREVPRFLKILDLISFPTNKVLLVAVSADDSLYKQSPGHQENNLDIFRVPVFIIYRNGIEINRIVEYPVFSLEKDLVSILSKTTYLQNYNSYPILSKWLKDGTLNDKNVSFKGLANQVRHCVSGYSELASVAYTVYRKGETTASITLYRMNNYLFPDNPNSYLGLAEVLYKKGDVEAAAQLIEKMLEITKDPKQIKSALELYVKIKIVVK